MAKKFPIIPVHPERVCWGCDKYCPVDALACGNGSERVQHPCELFGDDWAEWDPLKDVKPASPAAGPADPIDCTLPGEMPFPAVG